MPSRRKKVESEGHEKMADAKKSVTWVKGEAEGQKVHFFRPWNENGQSLTVLYGSCNQMLKFAVADIRQSSDKHYVIPHNINGARAESV